MKQYLILGATSDISVSLANFIAKSGDYLYLASRKVDRLLPLKNDLELKYNINVELLEFDAEDLGSHEAFYKSLITRPDVVINMFGYLGDQVESEKNSSELIKVIQTNFIGAASILGIVANDFEANNSGVIVGISSVAGDRGRASNYIYGSAKSGFTTYLSGLRNRLSNSNVHVCTVKPGFVYTEMTKELKLPKLLTAHPDDVAKDILKGIMNKKDTIYTKWFWKYIMLIIKLIPERIFKKLSL